MGYAADKGAKHATLEEAQAACFKDPTATGVTREKAHKFTCRSGKRLLPSKKNETTWLKHHGS